MSTSTCLHLRLLRAALALAIMAGCWLPAADGTGLVGIYFSTQNLSGTQVVRTDATVDFAWGGAAPVAGIGADHFSVRWTGQVQAVATEQVTFYTVSDDGIRLWVNGTLLIDHFTDHGAFEDQGSIALVAGQRYDIRLEFYENGGDAVAKLLWSSASIAKQTVPQAQLYPSVPAGTGSGLLVTYFDNANLTGATVTRTDAAVDFDWAGGSPASAIAVDTFSARWVGEVEARFSETYTFATTTDDGVRLWIGGQLVVDHWSLQSATERTGTIALTAGVRYPLVMEFYENGGAAVARLAWSSPSTPKEIIPSTQLYPIAPVGTGTGLLATYFDNQDFTGTRIERTDATVGFTWAGGSPDPVIAADTFSARWTGEVEPRTSETYTFTTTSDDGVRLWVDGQLLVDQWNDHGAREDQGTIALTAGKRVIVVMEFYERYGAAVAKLAWSTPTMAKAIIPTTQLYPAAALGTGNGLLAQYYDERDLSGPAQVRVDATVDFDWGTGSPLSAINPDTFSVRWSGEVESRYSETYTFQVTSDDGVRLWVGGQLLIDQWNDHAPRTDVATVALLAGHRYPLVMEYYENGGGAVAKLGWSSPSTPVGPIPAAQLYPAPAIGTGTGLLASYFDQPNFAGPALTRIDSAVDFDWAGGSPASAIAPDTFSVRWVGEVQAQFSETVTFQTVSDDGVRLWVNGHLLIDQWNDHGATTHSGSIAVVAGQRYPIVVEYYENGGAAVARLRWTSARLPLQPVPQSQLYPALIPGTGTGLAATYYDNPDFSGPTVTRIDPTINFDWSAGSPASGIGPDTFSVRWLGEVQPFVSETYTFTTISDDGIRVWVGDQLVIDHWTDHSASAHSGTIALVGGQHYPLRVEYYENGGAAVAKLLWASPSTPAGIIPTTQLYPAVDPGQTVAAPTLSPAGGTFTAGTVVTASTATPGAAIHYTLDGSDPTSASPIASGAITIAQNTTLTARAFLAGWNPSPATSGTYVFVATPPTISPAGGSFSTQQSVTLATATVGAEIRYTLDGSSPDQSSALFTAPFTIAATATVSARAFRAGWNPSAATTASFAFKAVAPLIAPAGGDFAAPQAVQVTSATAGAEVRYTLDGSDPTVASPQVSGPLTIDRNATLTTRAFRAGWTPSDASQAVFTFTPAAPTLSPAGGTFPVAQAVTLASATPETQIRYTLDGSEPSAASSLASGPVLVDASLTVRARAFRTGWSPSPLAEESYVLQLPAPMISPAGGSFTSAQTVTLSSSASDAAIHYTTDGSTPDEHSPLYLGAFVVPSNMTVSAIAIRPGWSPSTAATATFVITPVGQVPELWRPAPGFVVETIAGGLQLPVNVVFVPNPGNGATDPWLYITELYGTVKVVTRDGSVRDYATGLLDFAPLGAFPGSGEQGLAGILVEPETGDVLVSVVSAAGGVHHPRVLRLHSTDGGRTASSRTVLLDMPTPAITNSHMASNLSIGPDGKLYLHIGYGDDAASALDLESFGGKVIRFNRDGSPASGNPFFDAGDGISAKDYVFAYGLRNPFGGDWRASDGKHYAVENGPQVDRLARIDAGASYGYDGSNASMALRAIFNWNVSHAPVNLAFVQAATLGGSGFPIGKLDHAFVTESGPTFASGPQLRGKRISEFAIDGSGVLLSGPTPLVEYVGAGRSTAAGLAAGADGLYFTDLFPDAATEPSARGAQLLRVRHVGANPVLPVVTLAAAAAEITEGGAAGAFIVTRTGPVSVALPVAYCVVSRPDAASPDADYQALSGLVVIPAGASSVSIPLLTIDDQQAEGDEGVTIALAPGTGYGSGAQTGATITIHDNDTPRPVTVTVAIAERLQLIDGIGGNLANGRFTGSPTPNDAVGSFMLDAVPPAQARIGIPLKGWEPVNDNTDPANASPVFAAADAGDVHQVFVLMQQLAARGIPVVASIWDAPDWLVANPAARERRAIPEEQEAELTESIVAFLLRARDQYGVTVAAVSFNEADGGFQLVLTAQQHARLITAVSTRAAASGLAVRWLAGDTAVAGTLVQYAQPVLTDPAARPHLAALAYHTWDAPRVSDTVLGEISTLAQANGLPVWATEVGYDPLLHLGDPAVFASWSHAWQMGKASHRAFVHARATVVDLWSYQGDYPLAAGGVLLPAGKVAHQFATSLPRGTQRVRASADDAGVWALAAAHRALDHASLTLVNTYSLPVTVTVLGLPTLPCAIVRSDATGQEIPAGSLTPGASGLVLTLAAQSFTTLTTGLGFTSGNQPPVVAAGADQNVVLPAVASLSASVSDDGLPAGEALTSTWSLVSGPGTVGFADSHALATAASFSQAGTYVLAHSANDGLATSVDQVVITVTGGDSGTPPLVAFAAATSQQGEASGTVGVSLVLDHASSAQVSVTYELAPGGSATAGVDVGPVTGTVVFAPGDVTKSIPVAIIDDALDEDDESLVIRLALASGAVIGAPAQHTLTIADNDATPTVSFVQPTVTVAEAIGTLQVAVALSAPSGRTATVAYAVSGGSAHGPSQSPSDYVLAPGTLVFAPGETTKQISITVIDDNLNELDETIELALANAVNAEVVAGQLVVTISDNDAMPPVSFANSQDTVDESVGSAAVVVSIPAPSGRDITVQYAAAGTGDAINGAPTLGADADYVLAPGAVTITAGNTTATIAVAIIDDLRNEDLESLAIDITALAGGVAGPVQRTELRISDNDPLPSVSFTSPAPVVDEAAGMVSVSLVLSAASGRSVTVSFQAAAESGADVATNGDPSDAGTDVQVLPGQVVFAPGEVTAEIIFPIVDDVLPELSEHVTLVLSSPVNAVLGVQSTQAVVITDNDGSADLITVAASTLQVGEGAGSAAVGIVANHALAEDVQVHFIISSGTAVVGDPAAAGTDIGLAFGDVVLPAGALTAAIAVPVVDDTLPEPAENAMLTVTQVTAVGGGPLTGIYLGTPSAAVLTIVDNDLPQLAFGFDVIETDEGAAEQVSIPVTLSRASDQPVTVQITLDGSATNGTDYTVAPTSLTFAPGVLTATVVVSIIGDATSESDETVLLTLADPVGAIIAAPTPAMVLISNDDLPAPVVQYAYSTPTGLDIYGTVPNGFGISGVQVAIVAPEVITVANGEIQGEVFHVHVDNNAVTPSSGVTLSLTFNDDRTPTHVSAATPVTVPFGDGQGGDSSSGSPDGLPPVTPTVRVSIIGGLTGDMTGTVDGKAVSYSNQKSGAVRVRVQASASPSTITSVTLFLDGGQTFDLPAGTSVVKDLPSLGDGRYVISATATAANAAGETASGSATTSGQQVLIIDTVKPALRYILAENYRPAGFDPATTLIPTMRTSVSDDADLVLLNANDETGSGGAPGNKSLRFDRNMNVFGKSGFSVLAEVDDLSGLSDSDRQVRAEYKPDGSQKNYRSNFTMTLIPPVVSNPVRATDHGQRLTIEGLGGLPESLKLKPDMKVETHMGRYLLQIQARDRAGNQLGDSGYADQFKLWVDSVAPSAIVGTLGALPKNDREVVVTPVRFIYAHFDAAEAWQDTIDEDHRMLRLTPSSIAANYPAESRSLALWRLKTPVEVGVGATVKVKVQMMDFAGNRNTQAVEVECTRKSLNEESATSDHKEPVIVPGEIPVVTSATPNKSSITWFSQDESMGSTPGLFDIYKKKPQVFTFAAFSESEFTDKSRIIVNPLDPGSGASRRWTPAIINVAQSWKKPADVPEYTVISKDPGIQTIANVYGDYPSNFLSPTTGYYVDRSGDTMTGQLKLPHGDWRGGLYQVSYGSSTGRSSPTYIYVDYHQSAGFRWANFVRVHPDVAETGQRVTIRIEAGFLGDSLKWASDPAHPGNGEFNPLGDYVRFVYSGENDAQEAVTKAQAALAAAQATNPQDAAAIARAQANVEAANAAKAKSDPTETAQQTRDRLQQQSTSPVPTNRISIVGQRLVAQGANQSLQQQLELDLEIGAAVLPKLYHLDIACGEVKEGDDPQAQQFKASAGTPAGRSAHRVKQGLALYGIQAVEIKSSGELVETETIPISSTSPVVEASYPTAVVDYPGDGSVTAKVRLAGTVRSTVCDYVQGASISSLEVFRDQDTVPYMTIPVSVNKSASGNMLRPYPYSGSFNTEISVAGLSPGINVLRIVATDPVQNKRGSTQVRFEIRKKGLADPDPGQPSSHGFYHFAQPYAVRLDLSTIPGFAALLEGAEVEAVATSLVTADQATVSDTLVVTNTDPLVLSGGQMSVIVPDSSQLASLFGPSPTAIAAQVSVPSLSSDVVNIALREEAVGGQVLASDRIKLDASLGGNGMTVSIQRNAEAPVTGTLLASAVNPLAYTGGGLAVTLPRADFSASAPDGLTVTVSSTSLGLANYPVDILETGPASLQFSSSALQIPLALPGSTPQFIAGSAVNEHTTPDPDSHPLVLRVNAPSELTQDPQNPLMITTVAGARKAKAGPDQQFYVSSQDGSAPAFLFAIRSEGNGFPSRFPWEPPGFVERSAWFLVGFVQGFSEGGVALVEGVVELGWLVTKTVGKELVETGELITSLVLDPKRAEEIIKAKGDKYLSAAKMIVGIGRFVITIVGAALDKQAEVLTAIITRDKDKISELNDEFVTVLRLSWDVLVELKEAYAQQPPKEQGRIFGRAIFEIAALIFPVTKAGQLGKIGDIAKLSKEGVLEAIIVRLEASPLAKQGGFQNVIAKLRGRLVKIKKIEMCFVAGTLVETSDGPRPIEQVTVGQWVLSRDPVLRTQEYRRVVRAIVTTPALLYALSYRREGAGDGREASGNIVCTGVHPFYVAERREFVKADAISPGEHLMSADGLRFRVENVQAMACAPGTKTYNFEVEGFHTYFAGRDALWVHNDGKELCDQGYEFLRLAFLKHANSKTKVLDMLREVYAVEKGENTLVKAVADAVKMPIVEAGGVPKFGKLETEAGALLEKLKKAYGDGVKVPENPAFQAEIRGLAARLRQGTDMKVLNEDVVRRADFVREPGVRNITEDVYSPLKGTDTKGIIKGIATKAWDGKSQQAQSIMVDLGIGEGDALHDINQFTNPRLFAPNTPNFNGTLVDFINTTINQNAPALREIILFKNEEIVKIIVKTF